MGRLECQEITIVQKIEVVISLQKILIFLLKNYLIGEKYKNKIIHKAHTFYKSHL